MHTVTQYFNKKLTRVQARNTAATSSSSIILPLNCDRWIKTTSQRTQIIYRADASIILYHMALPSNSRVIESGTGTLGLTYVLSKYLTEGTVSTVEYNRERYEAAKKEIESVKMDNVSIHQGKIQDYLKEQASKKERANGLILDIPNPEEAVTIGSEVLYPNSKIVCFIPCIEQVQRVLAETEKTKRLKINRLLENIEIPHKPSALHTAEGLEYGTTPANIIRGHTGYILILETTDDTA